MVALIEAFYEARSRRDLAATVELLHPEVEWDTTDRLIEPDIYRGLDAVTGAIKSIWEAWEEIRWVPTGFVNVGEETVVAVLRVTGRGQGSGAPVDTTIAYVISVREGKLARLEYHGSKAEALEAVGLRE